MWAVIAILGAVAAFLLVIGGSEGLLGVVRRRVHSLEEAAGEQLAAARISSVSSRRLTQLSVVSGFASLVIAFALSQSVLVSALVAALALTVPSRWLRIQQVKRTSRLDEQLPDAIDQLVSSVRAGLSLSQAIEEAAGTVGPPMADEFSQIRNEERAGRSLPEAIEAARIRIGGRGFPMVAAALRVSLDKGGNLPEALQKISESLKEIWRLEQKLITASAEARKAVRVISWMPIVISAMVMLMQPELATTLTTTGIGWVVLIAVVLLYGIGLAWLKRLIEPDV